VLAAYGGMTYIDQGGNSNVTFVSGNNTYFAISEGLVTPQDTITAGTGQDTIVTGNGLATVFSGVGQANITLNDTELAPGGSGFGDIVLLSDGHNTVQAYGISDLIVATAPGQVINGGGSPGFNDQVILSSSLPGAAGDDLLRADGAQFTVIDTAGGNTIAGGSGLLSLVMGTAPAATTLRDTVLPQSGPVDIFGSVGTDISLFSNDTGQFDIFAAGSGDETLAAAGSAENVAVFSDADGGMFFTAGAGLGDFVEGANTTGSAVTNTVSAGAGSLVIFGGAGNDLVFTQGYASGGITYVAGADGETIQASGIASPMTVFGGNGGNLDIQAGFGGLVFVGGTSFAEVPSATIAAGPGNTILNGNDGDVLTLTSGGNSNATFLAGQGNETLDGSQFSGFLNVEAYNPADPINGGNVNESIIGGSGVNAFHSGAGYETFVAGTGTNTFQIDKTTDGLGGTITIYNYSSADVISFEGYSTAQEQAAIKSASPATDGVVGTQIMLSDQTTVLFVDAAASGLTFKL
jgi:Ca2+-binding RTX toxin-like protein